MTFTSFLHDVCGDLVLTSAGDGLDVVDQRTKGKGPGLMESPSWDEILKCSEFFGSG